MPIFTSISTPSFTRIIARQPIVRRAFSLIGLCSFLILSSCSSLSTNTSTPMPSTGNALFDEAIKVVADERYIEGIALFSELESRFPYGLQGELAKLNLIYSYYQSRDYIEAITAANAHIRDFPHSDYQDYVIYLRGLSQFYVDISFARRSLPLDITDQDLSTMQHAFNDFSALLKYYPDSPYAADARARMLYIRELLATKKANTAKYYLSTGGYIAAINRAEEVLQNFPNVGDACADALAVKSTAYAKLGHKTLSREYLDLLKNNYPDYAQLQGDRILLATPQKYIDWLGLLSFGLLSSHKQG